jgi:hypothetical protein
MNLQSLVRQAIGMKEIRAMLTNDARVGCDGTAISWLGAHYASAK